MDSPNPLVSSDLAATLPADLRLDSLGTEKPLLRALLIADLASVRQVPAELIDSLETVGEVQSWAGEPVSEAPAPATVPQSQHFSWPTSTPRAMIRPVVPGDMGALHAAFNDVDSSWRLPSRGRTVLPSEVGRVLEGADLQLVGVARNQPSIPVALMALNRYDTANMTAELSVIGLTRTAMEREIHRPHQALRFETVAMFLSHAFNSLNLYKITAAIPAFNWSYFADGAGSFFVEEGLQKEQISLGSKRYDVHNIAIFAEQWRELEPSLSSAICSVVVSD